MHKSFQKAKYFFWFCIFQAPNQVKTYAKNLVEGILTDTITKALSDAEDNKEGQETDVSLSLATEEVPELQECEDQTRVAEQLS